MSRFLTAVIVLFIASLTGSAFGQSSGWNATYLYNPGLYGTTPNEMIQASDGNYYGTANAGNGVIMQITPGGVATTIYSFTGTEGVYPSNLVQGPDGALYGTAGGGTNNDGIIFRCTLDGQFSTLHTFDQTDGDDPNGLYVSSHGDLYGTTYDGGPGGTGDGVTGYGVVFELGLDGTYTMIGTFSQLSQSAPNGELVEGTDGNLYGILWDEGFGSADEGYGFGQIFQIVPGGGATILYDFGSTYPNIISALGPLEWGSDGRLYTLTAPQDTGSESLLAIDPTGKTANQSVALGIDGEQSGSSGLIQGSDGNLYSSTGYYASSGGGWYQITYAGALKEVFNLQDFEFLPTVQGSDGNFYGFGTLTPDLGDENGLVRVGSGLGAPPLLPSPVEVTLSSASVAPEADVTLSWKANGAFSLTAQTCYASGAWSGKQTPSGSMTVKASSQPGSYIYSLTCGGNESGLATLIVNGTKTGSTTTMVASPAHLLVGQLLSVTATVSATNGKDPAPTGTVTFSLNGSQLVTVSLVNSIATYDLTLPAEPLGNYAMKATYNGDAFHTTSSQTTKFVVQGKPTVAVNISPSPVTQNAPVSVAVQVEPQTAGTVPTGTVQLFFFSGGIETALGTFSLKDGKANLNATAAVAPGSYTIFASYSGDSLYQQASGANEIVVLPKSTTTVAVSPPQLVSGQSATLSAAVNLSGQFDNEATGTVKFYGDGILLTTATVQAGTATATVSSKGIAAGSYSVVGVYSGDAYVGGSTSAPLKVVVTAN